MVPRLKFISKTKPETEGTVSSTHLPDEALTNSMLKRARRERKRKQPKFRRQVE